MEEKIIIPIMFYIDEETNEPEMEKGKVKTKFAIKAGQKQALLDAVKNSKVYKENRSYRWFWNRLQGGNYAACRTFTNGIQKLADRWCLHTNSFRLFCLSKHQKAIYK